MASLLLAEQRPAAASVCLAVEDFPPDIGGLAVSGLRLAGFLRDAGFNVHVVTPVEASPIEDIRATTEYGLTVHRVAEGVNRLQSRMRLHSYVKHLDQRVGFDLFHGFFLPAGTSCLNPARSLKNGVPRPVIASIRGSDATTLVQLPMLRPMLLQILRQATWVVSVNQAYLDLMAQEVDLAGRASVIRNGFPTLPFTWKPTSENAGCVGTNAKLRRVKDIPLLVRAFHAAGPAARKLLMVGMFTDPVEESWTHTLIDEFSLADSVEITGPLPHAQALAQFNRMRVYVQSSAFEGVPNAMLEAAATGVPVVATAVGGIPEIFTHGVDALLVPHGEPFALARAIRSVLENDALAEELSANAVKLCARYSHAQEQRAWVDLHQSLYKDTVARREALSRHDVLTGREVTTL